MRRGRSGVWHGGAWRGGAARDKGRDKGRGDQSRLGKCPGIGIRRGPGGGGLVVRGRQTSRTCALRESSTLVSSFSSIVPTRSRTGMGRMDEAPFIT